MVAGADDVRPRAALPGLSRRSLTMPSPRFAHAHPRPYSPRGSSLRRVDSGYHRPDSEVARLGRDRCRCRQHVRRLHSRFVGVRRHRPARQLCRSRGHTRGRRGSDAHRERDSEEVTFLTWRGRTGTARDQFQPGGAQRRPPAPSAGRMRPGSRPGRPLPCESANRRMESPMIAHNPACPGGAGL